MACPAAVGAAAAVLSTHDELLGLPRDASRSEALARAALARARPLGFGSLYEGQGLVK
jgi:subtilisin